MRAAAFLYPWDVVGDPEAARRLVGFGVDQVTLASAYHSVRALTPRHPGHRVVSAPRSAVYYPPDERRWAGRRLRPVAQRWMAGPDPYGEAAGRLADAGLDVHSWVVLAHNTRLGAAHPDVVVRNVHGDPYPWAPCIAHPEVRDYAADLAAEAAVRPGARGADLESCGWYGLEHLPAHDKIGGVHLDAAAAALLSWCFCTVCRRGYADHGADPEELGRRVAAALRPYWEGAATPLEGASRAQEAQALRDLVGADWADAVAAWRAAAADRFQRQVVAAVRAEAAARGATDFRVLLHADPAPHRCGANAGVRPGGVFDHADGVVVPSTGAASVRAAALEPFVPHLAEGRTLAANLQIVSGMGGRPREVAADAAHAASLGATELRLYHAGLASTADLEAVGQALREGVGGG